MGIKKSSFSTLLFLRYRLKSNDNFPSVGIHLTNGHDLLSGWTEYRWNCNDITLFFRLL